MASPADGHAAARFVTQRTAAPAGRIDAIQALRAIAVIIVVAYHLTVLFPNPHEARWAVPAPLYFGYAGVDLFFVLSGFIITHVTRRDPFDPREFAAKRVVRILPLYWLVTTIILALWLIRPGMVDIRADSALRYIVDSYLLLPTPERPLLGVGWTLEHEFQFYALIGILLTLGMRRFAVPALLILFAIGIALHVVIDPDSAQFWDWKLFSLYSFQFALGIIAYRINQRWRLRHAWVGIAAGVILFIATAWIATPLMNQEREVTVVAAGAFGLVRTIGYGVASFVLTLGVLALPAAQDMERTAVGRSVMLIGDASFSIYLFHNLVLQTIALVTRRMSVDAAFAAAIAAMIIVILSGIALHRLLERPLLKYLEARIMPTLLGHRPSTSTMAARR